HVVKTITSAFEHNGFAFVEIIAPCKTYCNENTISQLSSRLVDINETFGHNPENKNDALKYVSCLNNSGSETVGKIPVGIFWKTNVPTFETCIGSVKKNGKNGASLQTIFDRFKPDQLQNSG
ncbi:MAG: hypothetical protein Q4F84_06350, partial [Fibrobacter sp.]|nr:hypothetical protein [Fibrobacter sp.]